MEGVVHVVAVQGKTRSECERSDATHMLGFLAMIGKYCPVGE